MNPYDWFKGRVALVTGASSGMGQEIAVALGEAGAKVGIVYRGNAQGAQSAAERIKASGSGGEGLPIKADVSQAGDVQRMFAELEKAFGPQLDMLVNNAGDWMDKMTIADCTEAQWDKMLDVNAKSVFLVSRQAVRKMVAQKQGSIVNIGSVAGHTGGGGGTVPYAAAKAAVHTFTRGLAREMAPYGVRVNCISPGMIDTPMLSNRVNAQQHEALCKITPLGRFGSPREIAPAALYLLSPASSFVTGEILQVNGGLLMR